MKNKLNSYIFRFVIAGCLAITFALIVIAAARPGIFSPPVDLFVMAGQSNMQGFTGDAEYYPADPQELDSKIRFYWVTPEFSSSDGKWTKMQPQGGLFPKGHFGPEVTFARALANSGCNPAIFKYSSGGTSLALAWRAPGQDGLYDRMVSELSKAIALLEKEGYTVNVRAFIWIQGETDSKSKSFARWYEARFRLLINDLRINVLKNDKLPVILGIDEQYPAIKENPEVLEHHKAFARNNPFAVFTSMIGLEKADSTHLTPEGLEKHGGRLFDAAMKLVKCGGQKAKSGD
ncbi:MAG: hypothetical protein HY807_07950 [Nitrospirae bacterium]|nr:hypothetical protein [Nitrospirota bacterium]